MLVKLSTEKTVTAAAAALQAAVQANHFGIMQVHNLKETMAKKGVEFAHDCLIFEVCHPQQAKHVLEQDPERLHDATLPHQHLRRERQNHAGGIKTNHSSVHVQRTATGSGGAGFGKHHC